MGWGGHKRVVVSICPQVVAKHKLESGRRQWGGRERDFNVPARRMVIVNHCPVRDGVYSEAIRV